VLIDESGFMLQPTRRSTWAPVGRTPLHDAWDRRDRLSVLWALTVSPRRRRVGLFFDAWGLNITAAEVLVMLRFLRRRFPGGYLLVLDRWQVHRSAVRRLLTRTAKVEVEWLPPYAPELNPVEQVWQRGKHVDLPNFIPEHAEHLRLEVEHSIDSMSRQQPILRSFFAWAGLTL
jgi:transposase